MRVLLRVVDRDGRGRPRSCEIVYADTSLSLQEREVFVTAIVDEKAVAPRTRLDPVAKTDVKARFLASGGGDGASTQSAPVKPSMGGS